MAALGPHLPHTWQLSPRHLPDTWQVRRQGKKKTTDVFDPDYDMNAHFGRKGKKGGGGGDQGLKVGFGKRNPNDVRSRPKRT